ncbi:hypothetical protein [Actinocatenispora rupis]|uniref:PPE family protein n=1 Tax=Actinocatenispora rupis TaxID=519421 RepID=A0A8J3N9D3_9ACTN|nr:hypothetical protein [Actinocatenispora rupis]GID11209.1 hypothetical protein Aru02nite_20980 [Actinocatenispora rupis]
MGDGTWEAAVRQVTLPGRVDDIQAMKRPWHTLFGELDVVRDRATELQTNMTTQWKGPAATEFARKAKQIVDRIDQLNQEYSAVLDRLDTQATALSDAVRAIPVPTFGGQLPAGRDDDGTGGRLYDDYGDDRGRYTDFEALAVDYLWQRYAAAEADATLGTRGSGRGASTDEWSVDMGSRHGPLSEQASRDAAAKKYFRDVARTWYGMNKEVAHAAFDTLRTDWDREAHHMPTPTGPVRSRDGEHPDDRHAHQAGGSDVSANGMAGGAAGLGGGMSLGAAGSSPPGRYQLHFGSGRMPVSAAGGVGSSLAGGGQGSVPSVSDGVVGTGAGYGTGSGAASAGPVAGAGTAGGAGIGGYGAGAGAVGVGAGTAAGVGARPSAAEPVGPRSDIRDQLPGQRAASAMGRGANGAAGMVQPGAGKTQERDERQTWLIEDDDGIWQPKERPSHTGLIE